MSVTTLQVSGMTCSACSNSIIAQLQALPSVNSANVSLITEEAIVDHSNDIHPDKLVEVIEDMGFDAKIISSQSQDKQSGPTYTTTICITGMTCSACSNSITNALLDTDKIISADVSLLTEEATITHEGVPDSQLVELIEDMGFEATVISTKSDDPSLSEKFETEFNISGMTCTACVNSITTAVGSLKGVDKVNVSLMTESATVIHDQSLSVDDIKETIEDCGFDASVVHVTELDVKARKAAVNDIVTVNLKILGMTCSSCSTSVEQNIGKLDGVISCQVSLSLEEATIDYDSNVIGIRSIMNEIEDLGFDAILSNKLNKSTQIELLSKIREIEYWSSNLKKLLIFGIPIVVIGHLLPMFRRKLGLAVESFKICRGIYIDILLQFILGTYIQFWLAKKFYINCYKALSHGSGNMDVLICISTTIVYVYSSISIIHAIIRNIYPNILFDTSAMLLIFVSIGKLVESKAKGNTSTALSKLLSLAPSTCIIVENPEIFDSINKEKQSTLDPSTIIQTEVDVDLLEKNDIAIVLPGARVPSDGECIFGSSETDESLLTGESTPVPKSVGSSLIGGSVNLTSTIYMRITTIGDQTQLQQIVKLVKDAQISNAPVQRFADKIASFFVPSILMLSLFTLIFWSIFTGIATIESIPRLFLDHETNEVQYFRILQVAISVIVVACPCALGLAAPTAVMVGTGVGASNGILIKGGEVLEKASTIDTVIFDKTGTLTNGVMELTDYELCGNDKADSFLIWSLVYAIESNSEHPIAKALVKGAMRILDNRAPMSFDFSSVITHTGLGVAVKCTNPETNEILDVKLGNAKFMRLFDISNTSEFEEMVGKNLKKSKICSTCHILINNTYIGYAELSDTLKSDAKSVIQTFIKCGYSIGMVTGDSRETSTHVAKLLNIPLNNVLAEASPGDKLEYVKNLQEKYNLQVAFVGDGVNDAPALVQSDTGIAISSGTDIAMSASDIVLLSSNNTSISLLGILASFDISKKTFKTIKTNFLLAIVYNLIMLPIAMGLLIIPLNVTMHPMFASAAMACSSVSVVLNSLTLKNWSYKLLKKKIAKASKDGMANIWEGSIVVDPRDDITTCSTDGFIVNYTPAISRNIILRAFKSIGSLFSRRKYGSVSTDITM